VTLAAAAIGDGEEWQAARKAYCQYRHRQRRRRQNKPPNPTR